MADVADAIGIFDVALGSAASDEGTDTAPTEETASDS